MIGLELGIGLSGAGLGALGACTVWPNCTLFGPVLGRGPRAGRRLYLTFDDGPNPTATEAILDTLHDADVPAAFFMVGEHVRRHPELARRVAGAGHAVGNHTQHHVKLHLKGPRAVAAEIDAAHAIIDATTGIAPRFFRAPHGFRNPFVQAAARRHGYAVCGWTFGVWDTDRPGADTIRERVRRRLRPGAIILLHDGDGYDPRGDRSQTAAAVSGILADARSAGFEFRPLAELLDPCPTAAS
jgi:peptidoglycan/xylan/chitin deacetylase (PgdA/CDA1 family)